jgi:hypothetical protein
VGVRERWRAVRTYRTVTPAAAADTSRKPITDRTMSTLARLAAGNPIDSGDGGGNVDRDIGPNTEGITPSPGGGALRGWIAVEGSEFSAVSSESASASDGGCS